MNDHIIALVSLVFFTALVGFLTWLITRRDKRDTSTGFFLAGRTLTFPLIAGSLLLTNLSTEQMVGLNGDAFTFGLCVMAWEVVAVISLVAMAWFFLPRFLRSGITTVPEFLELRFDKRVRMATDIIFLIAYAVILLPMVLYTGAKGMIGILDIKPMLEPMFGQLTDANVLWLIVWVVGLIGAIYALFGGLRSVAVSDTLMGVFLLTGGFMITYFGISKLGNGNFMDGITALRGIAGVTTNPEGATVSYHAFNSIGGANSNIPFATIFTGVIIINCFYWCTNQQIIQRTFAAKSLDEGQKGVLLCGALKLLGPMYLVLPGIIAYTLFTHGEVAHPADAYGKLVHAVLPTFLTGFFAAAMLGAILSSFNSALNSTCTLFSLGLYKNLVNKNATEKQVVRSGTVFGWIIVVISMCVAPMLAQFSSIFNYLQTMNAIYFVPIFAVVLVALLTKRVPGAPALIALIAGVVIIATGYFVFNIKEHMNEYHFVAIVFVALLLFMLIWGKLAPRATAWVHEDAKAVVLTPWKHTKLAGVILLVLVIVIYASFANFTVLGEKRALPDATAPVTNAVPDTVVAPAK